MINLCNSRVLEELTKETLTFMGKGVVGSGGARFFSSACNKI